MTHKKWSQNLSIFILAAGLGERLRPVTEHIPKPLIPILGKPVLQSIFEKISSLPINNIGINLHHKKESIENWINQSSFNKSVHLFPEDPILGTGGALKNAEVFLKNSTFIVHNSDIISDMDLEQLIAFHLSSKNLVTLAVHNYPEFNNLEIDEEGYLLNISKHPHPTPLPSRERGSKENPPSYFLNKDRNSSFIPDRNEKTNNTPSPCGRGLGGGGTESKRFVAFTGIAVYQPEFLNFLPIGVSSVVDAWLRAIHEGYKIGTLDVSGCYWSDIGTPASYARAIINELRKNGEMVYIHPSVDGYKNIEMDGFVVIEKDCVVREQVSLRNCILLPKSSITNEFICKTTRIVIPALLSFPDSIGESRGQAPAGIQENDWMPDQVRHDRGDFTYELLNKCNETTPSSPPLSKGGTGGVFENCILGPGFKIDLKESEILDGSGEKDAVLIGTGGSDKKYFRIKRNGQAVVLMQCKDEDEDFHRHIEYTRFFKRYSISVPQLIEIDYQNKRATFEDLGDLSLYSWLKCPREHKQIEEIYKDVIDILVLIHTVATEHIAECPLLQKRIFDYEHLRWETSYFIERFVEGIRNIRIENLSALNDEFHRLALKVNSFNKMVIHRDFQSQNIMITRGRIPRILDYQGARLGPSAYDVVSILWDPYYRLDDTLRERLLDYYIKQVIPPPPPLEKGGNVILNAEGNAASQNPPLSPFTKGARLPSVWQGLRGITEKEFRESILPCRLQRHMQALGAYGFLSSAKGKKYFLKYVPEGLRLLKEGVALCKNEYTELYNLVGAL